MLLCTNSSSNCYGFDKYQKTIQHLDSAGLITAENIYIFSGCQNVFDSAWIHDHDTYYSYDTMGREIAASTIYDFTGGPYELRTSWSLDLQGNITGTLVQSGLIGNLVSTNFDTVLFNGSNNKFFEMATHWNTNTSVWDTITTKYWIYDSLNRNIRYDYYNFTSNYEIHNYSIFDTDSNLTSSINSFFNGSIYDSSRVLNSYDTLHHKTEMWNQKWDTLTNNWKSNSRSTYEYDINGLLITSYNFTCPNSNCADILYKSVYYYDNHQRLILRNDSVFDPNNHIFYWGGYDYTNRDINDNIVNIGYWIVNDQGCDESEQTINTYNSNQQLIHIRNQRYTCDYYFSDCDIFNLNEDSLLVNVNYPFQVCHGDTIRALGTVFGGTPPYNITWTPNNTILDLNDESPRIVADTTRIYTLHVTDSLGHSQSYSFTLSVSCFPVSQSEINYTNNYSVYPNPFKEETVIELADDITDVFCQVYDVSGHLLRSINSADSKIIFKKENLSSGFYFLSLFTGNKFIGYQKIIIE